MSQATAEQYDEESALGVGFRRVALYAVLVGMAVFYLLPIETGLMTSLTKNSAYTGDAPFLPPAPGAATLSTWQAAFNELSRGLTNSLLLTIPATVISAIAGSMTAYGLTHTEWRGQVGIYALLIAGIFIPYQAVLVPLSQFWYQTVPLREWFANNLALLPGIEQYHWKILALIITHVAYGIPICTLLFRSYYKDMSFEMIEAARLDGASIRRIYRRIVLPLSIPMFAVTLIYQFTQIWNDLLFALIIIQSGDASVVTMDLVAVGISQSGINFPLRMAAAFITALPTLLVYIIFGEQFAKGVAT